MAHVRLPFVCVVTGHGDPLPLSCLAVDPVSCAAVVKAGAVEGLLGAQHPGVLCAGDRLDTVNGEGMLCACCAFTETGFAIKRDVLLAALATRPAFRRVWTGGVATSQAASDLELLDAIVLAYNTDGSGELNDEEVVRFLTTLLAAAHAELVAQPRPITFVFTRTRAAAPPLLPMCFEAGRDSFAVVVGASEALGIELRIDESRCTALVASLPTGAMERAHPGMVRPGDRLDAANERPFLSSTAHFDDDGSFRIDADALKKALAAFPEFRNVFAARSSTPTATLVTASDDELVAAILAVYDTDNSGDLNDAEVVLVR
jgi:hypothetical protein